ncbi:homeobox-leucine zipper protein HAT9 [Cocos nucifera]|uniref:Homeobox-leucine zipper protein HAT9 n=1 Tax=Cocos nucifera TaxID=13894 RepID=A0A8K0IT05_COCNU|nr:homeobox-leucine zipper protein HAT9 [Cocos nucifera]
MEMSQDDMCDTGLALGLGIRGRSSSSSNLHHRHEPWPTFSSISKPCKPSLTLGLSSDVYGATAMPKAESHRTNEEFTPARLSSPHSTLSSFSSAHLPSIKMEKDAGSEEAEVERVFSRASDEEEDASARKKLRLTKEQSALLEERFEYILYRTKLKQTEVDCEILKRCCETLTDENRRLQKELQELKALKFASPLYMRFPAATLTMCPSCERVSGASNGSKGDGTEPFMVAQPKPHLFNPFTHSAAC